MRQLMSISSNILNTLVYEGWYPGFYMQSLIFKQALPIDNPRYIEFQHLL